VTLDVHDSLLTGYTVDGEARTIVLHTRPHQGGGVAVIDVIFRGVVAYHFEGDCLQNIVDDVEEVPVDVIGVAFTRLHDRHGWPAGWDSRREDIRAYLARVGAKAYTIICSYGLHGWVAAASMELREPE
jgi:hypothetical protein